MACAPYKRDEAMARGSNGHVHADDVLLYPRTIWSPRRVDSHRDSPGMARRVPPEALGLAHAGTEADALLRLIGRGAARAILEELRDWLSPRVVLVRPGTIATLLPRVVRKHVDAPTEHMAAATVSLRALLGTLALAHYAQVLGRIEEEGTAGPLLDVLDKALALVGISPPDPLDS